MKYVETSLEVASKYNPGLQSSILCPPKREYFFSRLDHAKSVIHLINKCFQPSVKQRIRNRLRLYKTVIKNFVKWGKYRIHILALIKRLLYFTFQTFLDKSIFVQTIPEILFIKNSSC